MDLSSFSPKKDRQILNSRIYQSVVRNVAPMVAVTFACIAGSFTCDSDLSDSAV